jgi:hypothetical protein
MGRACFDVCPSSISNPHKKQAFQLAYCLIMLEYIGAALHPPAGLPTGTNVLMTNGCCPPPPPIGGRPPCLPWCPTKLANGVCALQPPVLALPGVVPRPRPPRQPQCSAWKVGKAGIVTPATCGCATGTCW